MKGQRHQEEGSSCSKNIIREMQNIEKTLLAGGQLEPSEERAARRRLDTERMRAARNRVRSVSRAQG